MTRNRSTEGEVSIRLSEAAVDALHRIIMRPPGPNGPMSRKELSREEGYDSAGHFIPTADMFSFTSEVQTGIQIGEGGEIEMSPEAGEDWAKFLVSAYTCSCNLVSCGASSEYGCPIHRDTKAFKRISEPGAVRLDMDNNALVINLDVLREAFDIWFKEYPMGFTGRMCGDHALCMSACTYAGVSGVSEPVLISYFEAYMEQLGLHFDWFDKFYQPVAEDKKKGQSVGIVGAGPAGLMAAHRLLAEGYDVTIYEASDKVGGTIWHGVPHDKYNKSYLDQYRELLERQGCEFQMQTRIGQDISVKGLENRHDAFIDATGIVDKPRALGVKGEDSKDVIPAMKYLEACNRYIDAMQNAIRGTNMTAQDYVREHPFEIPIKGKTVIVVGVGYTGYDCVRTALRFQCDGNVENGFDGSLIWTNRRMEGQEPAEYPRASAKDQESPTMKMLKYAQTEGDAEQQFLRFPKEIQTDNAGNIVKIIYGQREVTNPAIAGVDPSKAIYRDRDAKDDVEVRYKPGEVLVIVAAGYDVGRSDTLLEKLGLVNGGKATGHTNLHTGRPGWYLAGDAAKGRPNEVVHCLNSAAECAVMVHRDLTRALNEDRNLKSDAALWNQQSAIPSGAQTATQSQLVELLIKGRPIR